MADNKPGKRLSFAPSPSPRGRPHHNADRYVPDKEPRIPPKESPFRVAYRDDKQKPVSATIPNASATKHSNASGSPRKAKPTPSKDLEEGEIRPTPPRQQLTVSKFSPAKQQVTVTSKRNDAEVSGNGNKDEQPAQKKMRIESNGEFMGTEKLLETGDYHDTIILVGKNRHPHKLHQAILCQNSGYFRNLLLSKDKRVEIDLSHVDPMSFEHVLQFLYHGKLPKPEDGSNHWAISWLASMFRSASYFDIPALKKRTIAGCVEDLSKPEFRRHYQPGESLADRLIKALKILFPCYDTEAESIDQVLRPLIENGFMRQVLKDEDMREMLKGLPKLTVRIMELQAEVITWLHSHGGRNKA